MEQFSRDVDSLENGFAGAIYSSSSKTSGGTLFTQVDSRPENK
jgi:hypothetical protein